MWTILHFLASNSTNFTAPLPHVNANDGSEFAKALNLVWKVVGSMSLLVITVAGLRYSLARGNPQVISQAKSAIAYAAVGLLISITVFSIVSFILTNT